MVMPLFRGPSYQELMDFYPSNYAWELRKKEEQLMIACVRGGMSYEDAKEACRKEFGARIESAEKQYEEDMKNYRARREERLREAANEKKRPWFFW